MKQLFLVLLCACGVVFAATGSQQKWRATSTTSISVTGNIEVSSEEIRFQNGQSLRLKPVAHNAANTRQVYKVVSPDNPSLLQGNTLCGPRPPTYLFLQTDGNSFALAVFAGATAPKLDFDVFMPTGSCATYHYER